ncbi:MAG: hypothetical protein IT267_03930 [Saprospiraceae bacterium]|nr:hypothetical protein [Saprospiraceae bacterium]
MKKRPLIFISGNKTFSTIIIASVIITFLCSFISSKNFLLNDPIKTVQYDRIETVSFAVSSDVDSETIHPSDILKARGERTLVRHTTKIDEQG